MKKAVIATGGRQYVVSEGDTLEIGFLKDADKTVSFEALLTIDGSKIQVGKPTVKGVTVNAKIDEQEVKAEKVTAIRYKAKKRVRKVRGHRQLQTKITVTKIGS